ncbi:MAG: lysylphosphatidylglycerol synthase transmembrane domain-containing protein [Candidatus Krumholzibacteriia bacterium]
MKIFTGKWLRILFQAAGIALFIAILSRVDVREVAAAYRRFNLFYLLYVFVTMVLFILVKSIRWKRIVALQGVEVPVSSSFKIYAAGLYLGVITPGRVGDFAKSLYLINSGMEPGKAIFSPLLDRMLDIGFLIVFGYVSLLFFPGIFKNQLLLSSLLVVVLAVAILAISRRRDLLKRFAQRFVRAIIPMRFRVSLNAVVSDTLDEFGLLTAGRTAEIAFLTMAAMLLQYLFLIVAAKVLGIDVSITILTAAISAAIFTSLLPVSFLGLGTRDAVLILIFNRVGISKELAMAFSFIFVLVYCIIGLLGLCCWLTAPFKQEKIAQAQNSAGDNR